MLNRFCVFSIISIAVVLSSSCFLQSKQVKRLNYNTFDKQAHRGGAGLTPENSIPGAINSIKNGWTIEMDLYISRDSQLVVTHDPHIVSLYALYPDGKPVLKEDEKKLVLNKMDYAEIRKFEIGLRPHPTFPRQQKISAYIPRFADLIDSTEAYAKIHRLKPPEYSIQAGPAYTISDDYRKFFVKQMMDIILSKKINDRSMFQSFDIGMLETVHRDYPGKIKVSYLVGTRPNLSDMLKRLTFKPDIYSPYFSAVTPELVKQCHELKIKIVPWTVNIKEDIDRLKAMGVDGIITDYPDFF